MYILKDNILGTQLYKSKSLDKITDLLLKKARAQVYHDDLDKQTYRGLYEAVKYSQNIKELNDFLTYELGYSIEIFNS